MRRKRTGWLRREKETWYVGLTLRDGKSFERKIPAPTDGTAYDETYANVVRAQLVRAYETGAWDPEAPQPSLGQEMSDPSLVEYVRSWAARQTDESAQQDRELVERYLAPSPFAALRFRELRPRQMITLIEWLKARPSARGGVLAPTDGSPRLPRSAAGTRPGDHRRTDCLECLQSGSQAPSGG